MKLSPVLAAVLLSVTCAVPEFAAAQSHDMSHASNGSFAISEGSAEVVGGTVSVAAFGASLVVDSIIKAGDASVVVLKDASGTVKVSLRVSGAALAKAALVVGSAVSIVAMSTGHLLVASGKAVAFIPNEIGKQLLHHSRVDKAGT